MSDKLASMDATDPVALHMIDKFFVGLEYDITSLTLKVRLVLIHDWKANGICGKIRLVPRRGLVFGF